MSGKNKPVKIKSNRAEVKERMSNNAFLRPKDATKVSRKSYRQSRTDFKLTRKKFQDVKDDLKTQNKRNPNNLEFTRKKLSTDNKTTTSNYKSSQQKFNLRRQNLTDKKEAYQKTNNKASINSTSNNSEFKSFKTGQNSIKSANTNKASSYIRYKTNYINTKKELSEAKRNLKVDKKVYKRTKAKDTSRVTVQMKMESKGRTTQNIKNKALNVARDDETLETGLDIYQKTQQTKANARLGINTTKSTVKLGKKTVNGTYGLGNRFFNLTRGRGFQRTPKDLTWNKELMRKARNYRYKLQAARELKKAQSSMSVMQQVFSGKTTLKQGASVIFKNPITLGIILLFVIVLMFVMTIASSSKLAIVQDDKDLTESWVYVTDIDAENSKDGNSFYSNIDEIMFFMNDKFEDYELNDYYNLTKNHKDYLDVLWSDLNGKPPLYDLKNMKDLMTDRKSKYHMPTDALKEYEEIVKELGYSTLDGQLDFPYNTDQLTVSRRYGYEMNEGTKSLNESIEIDVAIGEEIQFPSDGKVTSIPSEDSIEITTDEDAKLLLKGVKSNRYRGNEEVVSKTYLGNATKSKLTVTYKKYDDKKNKWFTVNPAFYFPKVTYTQQTVLASDYDTMDLSPLVTALIPKFKKAMKEVGMPEKFLPIMLAICMQESGGRVPDVMQSSESLGLPPNTLDTDASIKQGVKYMWENMRMIGLEKVNKDENFLKTSVQAYNFGAEFINYAKSNNGGAYTPELAVAFANNMSGGTGLYGDSKYVPHVWRYISSNGGTSAGNGQFFYPLPNKLNDISGFDYRYNPVTGAYELHLGLDFPVPFGTPVYASDDATVMRAKDVFDTYGINVVLKHDKGGHWTRYAHLSKANVSEGSKVKKGQLIGYVGSTGLSSGPHLHYEVMTSMYGGHVNPRPFIN